LSDKPKAQWYVYIVRCADDTLYAGVTTDCLRREREHNGVIQGGARYTRARRPVVMIYREQCENRSLACQREAAIKKFSRQQKLRMIEKLEARS